MSGLYQKLFKKYDVFLDFIIFITERINIAQVRILMLDYNS